MNIKSTDHRIRFDFPLIYVMWFLDVVCARKMKWVIGTATQVMGASHVHELPKAKRLCAARTRGVAIQGYAAASFIKPKWFTSSI